MTRLLQLGLWFILVTTTMSTNSWAATNSNEPTATELQKSILFEELANAENELEGTLAEQAIWRFWFDQSPSVDVRASLDAGISRREAYDFEAAEQHFSEVVESAPNYAEGYNQRAFIRFLRENYNDAQIDLEIALELEPRHFGAMAGLFLVLQKKNQQDASLKMLQLAVEIHPWLKERFALPKALWPESYRQVHDPDLEI